MVESPGMIKEQMPRALRFARIIAVVSVVRLLGLALISAPQSGALPAYFAVPFGIGDTLAGLTAIPVAYALGRGGIRTYALAIGWSVFALADIFLAFAVTTTGGLFGAVSTFFGPGILILPLDIITELAVLGLLLTKSVPRYMGTIRR